MGLRWTFGIRVLEGRVLSSPLKLRGSPQPIVLIVCSNLPHSRSSLFQLLQPKFVFCATLGWSGPE
jgi:hypothetical protein